MDHFESDQRNSVRVLDSPENPPSCSHGPMLLFERSGHKRFFSCSAYRDRKLCPAFVSEIEWQRTKKESSTRKFTPLQDASQRLELIRQNVLQQLKKLPDNKRYFCKKCGELFVDLEQHEGHETIQGISNEFLNSPPKLLPPLDHSKKEAQFFFSKETLNLILSLVKEIEAKNVLCVACPSVFDEVKRLKLAKCLMLDLDVRFRQFYDQNEFLLFNMFNVHFFEEGAKEMFQEYLKLAKDGLALVIDPPFGGKIEVLSQTLRAINSKYQELTKDTTRNISMFLVSPYFMEPQIVAALPDFRMMDYKVNYVNHAQFQNGPSGRKQGSPVRIFTNAPLSRLTLPEAEGYRFCRLCDRWTSPENQHCNVCQSCTSKDGRTYVHCSLCRRCVKPTWSHCAKCNRCALAVHPCDKFRNSASQAPTNVPEQRKRKSEELVAKSTSRWKVSWK